MEFGPIIRAMRHNKIRFGMIVLEVAITLAIAVNSINMIRQERSKILIPSGFDDENLVWIRTRPYAPEFREDRYLELAIESDLRAIAAIPGVRSVASTNFIPWQGGGSSTEARVAGSRSEPLRTQKYFHQGDLMKTLGVNVVEGRNLTQEDVAAISPAGMQNGVAADGTTPPSVTSYPVLITKSYANLMFKDGKAVGRRLEESDGSTSYSIVGVVDKFYNPYPWPIHEYAILVPGRPGSFARGTRYLVRTQPGAAASVLPELERRVLQVNSGRNIEVKTINEYKDGYFSGGRMIIKLMTAVIVLLVLVTGLGILGLASFSVTERTRQIGTRRALGATRFDIIRYFLLENWILTTAGIILGVIAAYGLNYLMMTYVAGEKLGLPLMVSGVILLWATGIVATLAPALRGSSISPATATRSV